MHIVYNVSLQAELNKKRAKSEYILLSQFFEGNRNCVTPEKKKLYAKVFLNINLKKIIMQCLYSLIGSRNKRANYISPTVEKEESERKSRKLSTIIGKKKCKVEAGI